jgi:hypothetical protein
MHMDRDQKQTLLEHAWRAEQSAVFMKEPIVRETMRAMAALYRDLATQIDELAEIKARARVLYYEEREP